MNNLLFPVIVVVFMQRLRISIYVIVKINEWINNKKLYMTLLFTLLCCLHGKNYRNPEKNQKKCWAQISLFTIQLCARKLVYNGAPGGDKNS